MEKDTDIGGPASGFPLTRRSIVQAAGSSNPEIRKQGFEALVSCYWKAIYKYLRIKLRLSNEDAKDLTQGFFTRAFEKGFVEKYDPGKARFRTYLRVCLDHFAANEGKAARRLKRGGDREEYSLDYARAESEISHHDWADPMDLEEFFNREWVRELFGLAVEELRRQCQASDKAIHFALFERYDLQDPDRNKTLSYQQLGEEFGLSVTQVTNYLAWARRLFRQLVLECLRAATGSQEEFEMEARRLAGGDFQ